MARPRIACFHGGGSSASIYAVQCASLQKQLQQDFEFVFFEAPFTRDAGPGVLPWFSYEEYGPYKTWFSRTAAGEELGDGRADMSNGEGGVERVLRLIESYDEDERVRVIEQYDGNKGPLDVGKGEWVGVMGFSQGTRVVGGLLLHQQRRRELGLGNPGIEFKFGVLCMGSAAPMLSDLSDAGQLNLIKTPTLHLHGLKDKFYTLGKVQLSSFYDQIAATVWDIDYHHAMPWYAKDVTMLAEMIRHLQRLEKSVV